MASPAQGGNGMLGFTGTSYALFAIVWSGLCLLSGAVVTDTMLRDLPNPAAIDSEQAGDAAATEI